MDEGAGGLTATEALCKAVEELTGGSAAYFYAELFARAAALMIGDGTALTPLP